MDVDPSALAAWSDFLRFHATVTDVLGEELQAKAGIPLSWYDVLVQLQVADGRLRMQDLASAVVLSKSGLTRLVDRLEEAGMVRRMKCGSDRRGTFAEITPAGRKVLEAARPIHHEGIATHFAAHLDKADIAALGVAFAKLVDAHGRPDKSQCP